MRPVITFTTDFGHADPFVGIMKGVALGIAPSTALIDLVHQIEPQNILQAACVLQASYSYFPKKTVYLAVVDP
ncbi:MAG: SAM-dependent chlorinase/fluorinase, partial [Nitrospinales bacterium]